MKKFIIKFYATLYLFGTFYICLNTVNPAWAFQKTHNSTEGNTSSEAKAEEVIRIMLQGNHGNNDEVIADYYNKFEKILEVAVSKFDREKAEKKSIEKLYYSLHRKYLKKYRKYSSFEDLIDKGVYDCLTGTAFYAFVLKKLDMPFDIIETNYHIFIVVHGQDNDYLIESTDPLGGVISDPIALQTRLDSYKKPALSQKGKTYVYPNPIYKSVSLQEMAGLYFYNAAIDDFNYNNLSMALHNLKDGITLYDSDRLKALMVMILNEYVSKPGLLTTSEQFQLRGYKKFLVSRTN